MDESRGTVWVVPGYMENQIVKMFQRRGFTAYTERYRDDDPPTLIVLTGGADVNPKVYGQPNLGSYGMNDVRDAIEIDIYNRYKDRSIFLGICRGAQLLNVLNGGQMIQDLPSHHGGTRIIYSRDFGDLQTEECHHQGMVASEDGEVLAIDPEHGNDEVIWYPVTYCFCFQAHPEYGHKTEEVFFKFLDWIGVI